METRQPTITDTDLEAMKQEFRAAADAVWQLRFTPENDPTRMLAQKAYQQTSVRLFHAGLSINQIAEIQRHVQNPFGMERPNGRCS